MGAVGKTPNGFKFIKISSHTTKSIQEGSAKIICEDIDILSHATPPPPAPRVNVDYFKFWENGYLTTLPRVAQNINIFTNIFSTPLLNVLRGM